MDALKLIKDFNPFPAVCGSICNRRCEQECTRGLLDAPLAIDEIKKFIAEQDLNAEHRFVPEIVVASNLGRWKEKIAVIGGDREVSDTSRLRFEGCVAAFSDHGIPFDPDKDYQGVRYSYQDGYLATKALLASGREFTALFASADVMAIGAIRALEESGKRVPEDVSVMGLDGLPIGDYLVPQLTTVGQCVSTMARRSVEILLGSIEEGKPARHETVPFQIYRRESVRELQE